ncbi:hypothetical protein EVAR_79834_1 [Eumeta japonica]|uniref:Uncharacterized protein n=1 Tax=Eumeta variegata TaxID=151549 RepID=A0A4C1WQ42_EUMVA|nr:hypothetical protein EVAR_79834_1 [Eumeta japonica]
MRPHGDGGCGRSAMPAGRAAPLLVGSVASNMGYSEAVSTLAALVKVCLAYHKGWLARTALHDAAGRGRRARVGYWQYRCAGRRRRPACPIQIRGDQQPVLQSGNNGHVLLQGYYKEKPQCCGSVGERRLARVDALDTTLISHGFLILYARNVWDVYGYGTVENARDAVMLVTPMTWQVPRNHDNDSYFCAGKINRINPRNRNKWLYPNFSSVQRPQSKS